MRYSKVSLEISPTRYGYIASPYKPQLLFDYNHVYNSIDDIIKDFNLNGWDFNGIVDGYYEFERRS